MEEKKAKVCIEKCWRYLKHMAPHFSFLYIRSWLVCDHMYFFLTLSILVITDQVQKEKKKKVPTGKNSLYFVLQTISISKH